MIRIVILKLTKTSVVSLLWASKGIIYQLIGLHGNLLRVLTKVDIFFTGTKRFGLLFITRVSELVIHLGPLGLRLPTKVINGQDFNTDFFSGRVRKRKGVKCAGLVTSRGCRQISMVSISPNHDIRLSLALQWDQCTWIASLRGIAKSK